LTKFTFAKILPLLAAATLMISAPAQADGDDGDRSSAARLITPTLWAEAPVYFACNLTNVGKRPRKVTTRIVNGNDGTVRLKETVILAP
jgi:hypothetical protein